MQGFFVFTYPEMILQNTRFPSFEIVMECRHSFEVSPVLTSWDIATVGDTVVVFSEW